MVKRMGRGIFLLTAACSLFGGIPVWASAGGPGVRKAEVDRIIKYESGIEIDRLKDAQDTDQIVVVLGTGMDNRSVGVAYFKKDEAGDWQEEFYVPGYCGYYGMSDNKAEGDRRTPTGTYKFTKAFGILDDPGAVMDYKKLDHDDYWVDDSTSACYNQMVSTKTTAKTWRSAEHLIKVNPCYNYVLALGYNEDCISGKGSAIFLHGMHPQKNWSEGCVAIDQEYVKQLVCQVDAQTKIVIAPDADALLYH